MNELSITIQPSTAAQYLAATMDLDLYEAVDTLKKLEEK